MHRNPNTAFAATMAALLMVVLLLQVGLLCMHFETLNTIDALSNACKHIVLISTVRMFVNYLAAKRQQYKSSVVIDYYLLSLPLGTPAHCLLGTPAHLLSLLLVTPAHCLLS
jgi:hypothetical protein